MAKMPKVISKEMLAKDKPYAKFKDGFDLNEHIRIGQTQTMRVKGETIQQTVAEFIGTDNFSSQWYERQRYEVDAGRDQEPLLYQTIYNEIVDSNLPRSVTVNKLGPAGVVLEQILEGGEVKFMSVGGSSYAVTILHYAVGLQYNKDLMVFNELWRLAPIERQLGIAYNALRNHVHLYPIVSYSYAAANQTAASSVGSTLAEKYVSTLEDAITASKTDTSNPRRGPYDLLIPGALEFKVTNALKRRLQDGIDEQSDAISQIQNIIVYDGWTGTRGMEETTYAGVTAGKGLLVSKQYREQDFQSFVKQGLESAMGNPDLSRFIIEQTVWDTYMGVYANPIAAVEEITWPTS